MKALLKIAYWLVICCVPLLILTTNIRIGANEIKLYEYGISTYKISQATGISDSELKRVHQHIIDYYNYRENSPQVTVKKGGKDFQIFSDKELVHLKDVRALLQLDYLVQVIATILFIVSGVLLCIRAEDKWPGFIKALLKGSLATCCIVVLAGILSFFFFDQLFLLFHLISFSNEFWILDPSRDYLIMLFPGQFFYDIALFGFGAVIIESLVLTGIAYGIVKITGGGGNKAVSV